VKDIHSRITKRSGIFILFLFFINNATAQLNKQLFDTYSTYQEKSINTRRFKHNDIMAILEKLDKDFTVKQVGHSVEGKPIKLVTYGNGPVNVLMWSQMHGDETTATRAILDMFIWLEANDQFNEVRNKIKSSLTLHVIPMLNPDGASRFTRRNHFGIDINRDALRLQTPEGRTLKRVRDSLKADWGFNLHDQGRGTSVNGKPATISLLAPPFNVNRDVHETRGDAMQLAKYMFDQIDAYIPNQIGIYPDDFEPRAFGDNMQKWGTRTVLIESGGLKDDFEKQEIRKLNFILLLTALESISGKTFEKTPVDRYNSIPKNADGRVGELIIYNLNFEGLIRDAAFDRREEDSEDFRNFYAKGYISDLGDLSTLSAYVTFDAKDYEVLPGKMYDKPLATIAELLALDTEALLKQGITDFIVQSGFNPFTSTFKFNIHSQSPASNNELRIGGNPSLVFAKNGVVEYVLINGVLSKLIR
jgi:hypothetical protein